ncbi:MAG: hypothetical protein Q7R57_04305, partial [Dehalococcoidales bacterium]|nr:hypothetical protein [Dehalococcoidales bacterium]
PLLNFRRGGICFNEILPLKSPSFGKGVGRRKEVKAPYHERGNIKKAGKHCKNVFIEHEEARNYAWDWSMM